MSLAVAQQTRNVVAKKEASFRKSFNFAVLFSKPVENGLLVYVRYLFPNGRSILENLECNINTFSVPHRRPTLHADIQAFSSA